MKGLYYILKGHEAVHEHDPYRWARFFETGDRIVARTQLGAYTVSTVFLGIDHRFGLGEGPPVLFETMILRGDKFTEDCFRCCTWAEAEAQHAEVVRELRAKQRKKVRK